MAGQLMSTLLALAVVLALYCSAEVAAVWMEAAGIQPYAGYVELFKPAWTWCITLVVFQSRNLFVAWHWAVLHVFVSTQMFPELFTSPSLFALPTSQLRYCAYPAITGIVALSAASVFRRLTTRRLSSFVVVTVLLLHACSCVHEVIWRMVLPAPLIADYADLPRLRERHRANPNVELFDLPSSGSPAVTLSGAVVRGEQQFGRPPRVLLYLGGNGDLWERNVWIVESMAKKVGATAVLFNYRGVGNSGGVTRRADGMAVDASDVIKFLLRTTPGLLESDILIFGHSIGGGVAAAVVATKHRECSVVFDRTFSSMPDAAKGLFSKLPMGLIRPVVAASFGMMDTSSLWPLIEHERKLVMYHRGDGVINFAMSSLARGEAFQHGPSARYVVELHGYTGEPHNNPISDFKGSEEATQRMAAFFR